MFKEQSYLLQGIEVTKDSLLCHLNDLITKGDTLTQTQQLNIIRFIGI